MIGSNAGGICGCPPIAWLRDTKVWQPRAGSFYVQCAWSAHGTGIVTERIYSPPLRAAGQAYMAQMQSVQLPWPPESSNKLVQAKGYQ